MQHQLIRRVNEFIATETIIEVFEFIIRSTTFLMTNNLKQRDQLMSVIKRTKDEFQMLLSVTAVVANVNSCYEHVEIEDLTLINSQ
jgi:hypothetical protein